ncbi:MAG: DNA polymerase III subunit delta [Candidatus Staskawiczbacteria bacterium RIFCSPLOWO2_01_FULL_38_12b]|uniref:DNA polymerase III subunit delta n=1 Tax=Candidatus Staskawiczbacteria bacterium RIFCSPLOWO2_01_FULL_38_12b TaxID=1802214 RepID=A0A1G2II39_9BACT|nr:MAG: DNA polymerase III subunit delta [Candidatus Staskawiczbacteria bacterium RIFCSPLOWO2_01_FULL_38_12b]
MIIFLYGQDSYRAQEKLSEIIAHYKEVRKSGLNLIDVDAGKTDFSQVYDVLKISSMFAETKLVTLKNVFSGKSFQEDFLKELKLLQSLKDVIVVFENDVVDQRLKLFKLLLKECKSQEFALLDSKNLKIWAQKEFEKLKAKINNDALDALLSCTRNDLWRLFNEIKKLVDFKDGQVVRKEDVQMLVKPNIETDIFKTIDALAQKDKKQALGLLHNHLENGDNSLYLLSMIAFQFRNLLMVKELSEKGLMYASIVKKSGLHPFVVKKSYFLCRQFSFEELKNIYRSIFKIDSDIKIGKIDAETALDLFVSKI